MTGRYLLAIDAGTGSCRAVLFTETGEQVAVGQREWVHREPPGVPGGQDFDVAGGWRAVGECVRDALRQAEELDRTSFADACADTDGLTVAEVARLIEESGARDEATDRDVDPDRRDSVGLAYIDARGSFGISRYWDRHSDYAPSRPWRSYTHAVPGGGA